MKIPVKITLTEEAKELYPNGKPEYATEGSSGFDIKSVDGIVIQQNTRTLIKTGLKVQLQKGCELQIRPRSGLALKYGITVLNTPATIDSDYRGELMICLYNSGSEDFKINVGDRIAQGVIAPVFQADFEVVETLEETRRGEGGFGSTGVK